MIQDLFDFYTSKFQHYVNLWASWCFSYAVWHLIQVRWGYKEAGCVFGAQGLGGFLICTIMFVMVGSLLATYLEYKKSKKNY